MTHSKLTLRVLLALAIPSILSQMLNNAFRIIDQYSIQWLGAAAQSCIGVDFLYFNCSIFNVYVDRRRNRSLSGSSYGRQR